MISDNFLGNKPDLNRMFAEHCARRGWLKFGFGYAAMVREAKQFIARCVARGWCKFNPPKPQEVQAAIKSKRVFCSGGKTWHRYNRMGFCDVCGQERTRAPKKNFRAATQHRPTNLPASQPNGSVADAVSGLGTASNSPASAHPASGNFSTTDSHG